MGKSPAKWIKTVVFGKKSSKPTSSSNVTIERRAPAKLSSGDSVPVVSDSSRETTDRGGEMMQLEKGMSANIPCDVDASLPTTEGVDLQDSTRLNLTDNAEIRRQEQAAIKAQAAFRGYLARRAFLALKGIIRLQALIRGHLVRRQAVATLHCMQSIVKFQALARGRRVRSLYPELQVLGKYRHDAIKDTKLVEFSGATISFGSKKLATNTFARKLVTSLPTAMPLSLQYDLAEPNSAWNWLERWSLLCFWKPLAQTEKIDAKSQASSQAVETETGRPKRTARKVSTAVNNASNSLEFEKSKRNSRKVVSHQTEPIQEQPQLELERVKRNLRKISASTAMAAEKSEVESEGPKNVSYSPAAPAAAVSKQGFNSSEKLSDLPVIFDELSSIEAPLKPLIVDEPVDMNHKALHAEENGSENSGKVEIHPTENGALGSTEDQISKEKQKTRRRSLPAKQEYPENVSQNTPSLPSYMAATKSAKAKLRAQMSPRLGEEGNGNENGFARRHSLPSSASSKLASLSPRVQRPLQANGKGGNKSNKPLLSPSDDKSLPGWRR